MRWQLSNAGDQTARRLADRHYSRQKPGTPQFLPPGRKFVLRTADGSAVWATSWPFAEYVKHAWAGAWINSIFRNESGYLSSDLIREAIAATRWYWPDVPELGIVTMVDAPKIRSTNPGYCYIKAGFTRLDRKTEGGLIVLQLLPDDMPPAQPPAGAMLPMMAAD